MLRRVAAMAPLIIRICATEGGLATRPLGAPWLLCQRESQNNAACSYLLGFLLGFLDSKRCGTRSSPGPRLVLVLLVLHTGSSDPPLSLTGY